MKRLAHTERRSDIESRGKPVADVLVPVFFMTVGVGLAAGVVSADLSAVLVVVAMLTTFVVPPG
jgi:Kef-type K+ transport system membrane component KefB